MFISENVWMVVKSAKLSVVEDDKKVEHRMAEVQLVIEDLPSDLAHELGEDVASHLFTDAGAVRHELATITLDPRIPNQCARARQTVDTPGTELRDAEILSMTFARQEDDKTGKEWIKATARVRFDLAPKVHREWLAMHFGYGLYFSFEAEQGDMLSDRTDRIVRDFVDANGRIMGKGGSVEITTMTDARQRIEHELKTWPAYFAALMDGRKTFELRRDDRGFREGDDLRLREWDPDTKAYSGVELRRRITYVLRHSTVGGLADGFVVLGLADPALLAAAEAGAQWKRERDDAMSASCRAYDETVAELARLRPLAEAGERLREALKDLVIDANRLCDRQLGGSYEDDCRATIAKARQALALLPAEGATTKE